MKEETMTRKYHILTMLSMVLLVILLMGCAVTPTPDPSIVWSDDFEDGDMEGWEEMGDPYVEQGAVYFGESGGVIFYRNPVKTGTWSFDAFLCEESVRTPEIWFIVSELGNDQYANITINITKQPITKLNITHLDADEETTIDVVTVKESEILTGWHHVDITRDDADHVKIYVDQALIYEFNQDFPYESDGFFYYVDCQGPALDNVVVRDQVIDIQTEGDG